MVFEPRVGGHVYDRGVDGSECRWARVLAYEPPNRVVISWDINTQWQLETDLEKTSEVEVRFVAEAPDRTRVELEHRNLDRHGEGWEADARRRRLARRLGRRPAAVRRRGSSELSFQGPQCATSCSSRDAGRCVLPHSQSSSSGSRSASAAGVSVYSTRGGTTVNVPLHESIRSDDESSGDLRERRPGRAALRGRPRPGVPGGLRADRRRGDQHRGRRSAGPRGLAAAPRPRTSSAT